MLKRLAFPVGLAIAAFLLGWLLGRDGGSETAPPAASAEVELRLDAGSLTLMPDGGLHLKPIEPLLDAGPE